MKREFSSLSENFSPLQRLACISKGTASVCSSCVCVCVFSCCPAVWGVKAGGGCAGDTRRLCVSVLVWMCVWVYEPPLGLNSSLSHQSAHQGSAGDGGQALPAIWSCKRFQGAVYLCMSMCVRLCAIGMGGGGGAHTRPVYPPISIRQTARKFQQSAREWWWWRGGWQKPKIEGEKFISKLQV